MLREREREIQPYGHSASVAYEGKSLFMSQPIEGWLSGNQKHPPGKTLRPINCNQFIASRQATGIPQVAWHPLHSACFYAIARAGGGLQLIDAKASRCVQSWTEDELRGPAMPLHPAVGMAGSDGLPRPEHADDVSCSNVPRVGVHNHNNDDYDDDFNRNSDHDHLVPVPHTLSWSQDGRRLAIASGASLTSGARCCMLHFSDSAMDVAS